MQGIAAVQQSLKISITCTCTSYKNIITLHSVEKQTCTKINYMAN